MKRFVMTLFVGSALVLCGCPESNKAPPSAAARAAANPPPGAAPAPAPRAPASAPVAKSPPVASGNSGDVAAGKRLFMTACANCHGPDGTGALMRQMMPAIGNLTLATTHAKYDDDAFAKLISEGRNKMPPFKAVFKPEQINQIIAFARTLEKG
jgi:mono/diheme cytochrome c family protein